MVGAGRPSTFCLFFKKRKRVDGRAKPDHDEKKKSYDSTLPLARWM